jgi:gamma-glutamylcyclotransferase
MLAAQFLGDPAWQGIGALAGILATGLGVWEIRRRRKRHHDAEDPGFWSLFNLSTDEGEKSFYDALAKSIREAREEIYRSGRGFARPRQNAFIRQLLAAEETALENDVEITRIQTSARAVEEWAIGYAKLVEKFDNLRMLADLADPPLVNVALIDPGGKNSVIQLLFESEELSQRGPRHRGAAAIFLYGQQALALSLKQQFEGHSSTLVRMTASDVRELARSYVYFAYGSNLSQRQMKDRCPDAHKLGVAILYGWVRTFSVPAAHLGGGTASIEPSADEGKYVEGVAYELSPTDKLRLDDIERGGYAPQVVGIKLEGKHVEAYTHVPLDTSANPQLRPTRAYVDIMMEGAKENGLTTLHNELQELRRTLAPN